jgi:NAD(P)-dependent dehydrogenase (short-subunit alcohol dehydrogenase family)
VAELGGGLNVLVNNAGIGGPTAPVKDIEPDDWEAVLRVDLTGTFLVSKYAIPHLIAAGSGAVINMSSAGDRFGYPNRSPYAAAKWGLIGFTKTLSMESWASTTSASTPSPPGPSPASGLSASSRDGQKPPVKRWKPSGQRR